VINLVLKKTIIYCLFFSLIGCQHHDKVLYPNSIGNDPINVIIEIPAGTVEKWELNKKTGIIERDSVNRQPRTINYLGYPANYGIIPNTLSAIKEGGDGDPLDVFVLGPPLKRGATQNVIIIGMIEMIDNGESDNKFLAVPYKNSSFSKIDNMIDLNTEYPELTLIITTWLKNYKGKNNHIIIKSIIDRNYALDILSNSMLTK